MSKTKDMTAPATQVSNREALKTNLPRFTPTVDIFESDSAFQLLADLPGVKPDDITVNVEKGRLFLSGVRRLSSVGKTSWQEFTDAEFKRTFAVPQTIDVDQIEAQFNEGVLSLTLPKSAAAQPRKITIATA